MVSVFLDSFNLLRGWPLWTIFIILAWAALEFLGLGDGTIPGGGGMLYWAQQAGALGDLNSYGKPRKR